jgi:hypothetical protein
MFGRFADADFVAHAHQDIPALVAEVERLQALLDGLQIAHKLTRQTLEELPK